MLTSRCEPKIQSEILIADKPEYLKEEYEIIPARRKDLASAIQGEFAVFHR
jgi:hypothetical protein